MQNNNYPGDSRNYGDESEENHKWDEDHRGVWGETGACMGSFDEEFGEADEE